MFLYILAHKMRKVNLLSLNSVRAPNIQFHQHDEAHKTELTAEEKLKGLYMDNLTFGFSNIPNVLCRQRVQAKGPNAIMLILAF